MERANRVSDIADARARKAARQLLEPWTVDTPNGPVTCRRITLTDVVDMVDEDAAMLSALSDKFLTLKDVSATVGQTLAMLVRVVTLAPDVALGLLNRKSTLGDLVVAQKGLRQTSSTGFEQVTRLHILRRAVFITLVSSASISAFLTHINGD